MEISPLSRISTAVPVDPVARPLSNVERMQIAVRELNHSEMFGADRQLEFARDDETQKMVIRIVQRKTGEVLGDSARGSTPHHEGAEAPGEARNRRLMWKESNQVLSTDPLEGTLARDGRR